MRETTMFYIVYSQYFVTLTMTDVDMSEWWFVSIPVHFDDKPQLEREGGGNKMQKVLY